RGEPRDGLRPLGRAPRGLHGRGADRRGRAPRPLLRRAREPARARLPVQGSGPLGGSMMRRRVVWAAVVALLAAVAAAGCGGGGGSGAPTPDSLKEKGKIVVGTKFDQPLFGQRN